MLCVLHNAFSFSFFLLSRFSFQCSPNELIGRKNKQWNKQTNNAFLIQHCFFFSNANGLCVIKSWAVVFFNRTDWFYDKSHSNWLVLFSLLHTAVVQLQSVQGLNALRFFVPESLLCIGLDWIGSVSSLLSCSLSCDIFSLAGRKLHEFYFFLRSGVPSCSAIHGKKMNTHRNLRSAEWILGLVTYLPMWEFASTLNDKCFVCSCHFENLILWLVIVTGFEILIWFFCFFLSNFSMACCAFCRIHIALSCYRICNQYYEQFYRKPK